MNGLTLIHKEFMQIIKSPKFLIPVIAVILAPVIYAGMFIWAFKDPYAKMDKVPVAVINQDMGAKMDGNSFHIGRDLAKNLKKSNGFDFNIVSEREAMDGLDSKKYYMVVKIPKDFSENATTLLDKNPKKLQLQYIPNDSTNFLVSQIGGTALLKVKDKVAAEVSKTYAETIFEKATEMANGFKTASNGAKKLNNGANQLGNGVSVLRKGANTLYDGQVALNTGITKVNKGAKDLNSGAANLHNGSLALNNGIIQANHGAGRLNSGAGQLYTGAVSLNSGAGQVNSGAQTLKANLEKLARSSVTFSNGLSDAKTGSEQLATGSTVLKNGLNELAAAGNNTLLPGAQKLQKGSNDLHNGTTKLAAGLKEAHQQIPEQLLAGTQNIQDNVTKIKQQLPQGIAENVHGQLASSVSGLDSKLDGARTQIGSEMAKQLAAGMVKKQIEQTDALVAQVAKAANPAITDVQIQQMQNTAEKQIKDQQPQMQKELETQISAGLEEPFGQIQSEITGAMPSQKAIASSISAKTNPVFDELNKGISSQFNTKIVDKNNPRATTVESTLNQLAQGAAAVNNGAADLNNGETAFVQGLQNNLLPNLNKVSQGAADLNTGAAKLENGLARLDNGAGQLQDGTGKLADGSAKLADGTSQLQSGSAKLADGSKDLQNGAGQLSNGTAKLANGSNQLVNGSSKLADGTNTLTNGTGQLVGGSNQLVSGTQQLSKGSGNLSDGTKKLKNGTNELKKKLGDAAKTASAVQANNKTYNMMAEPVSLNTNHYHRVPNYGTGFTPYFLSLGLFVGALLITIVYPLVESAGIPKSGFGWFASKISILTGVGILQAIVADIIILNVIDIHVKSVPLFVLFSFVTSLTFITLIQFLVTLFQNPGRFLAIVILILQLTSSAGTFPLEVIPKFIQWFNPLLPMTYTVKGFKAVISSGEFSVMWQNAGILLIYIVVAELLTLLYFVIHYRRQYGPLHEHAVAKEV